MSTSSSQSRWFLLPPGFLLFSFISLFYHMFIYEVREIIEERVLKAVDPLYHSARTKETTNMAIIRYGIRTVLVFCVVGITIGIPDFEDMVALGFINHHFIIIIYFNLIFGLIEIVGGFVNSMMGEISIYFICHFISLLFLILCHFICHFMSFDRICDSPHHLPQIVWEFPLKPGSVESYCHFYLWIGSSDHLHLLHN